MIKWISDSLGTASYDRISEQVGIKIVDVRDLVDKPGNLPVITREKIDEALASLRRGERVVVCCDYGISRSNAIAAGILSEHEEICFEDAIRRVIAETGEKEIKIEVLSAVRNALQDTGTRNKTEGNDKGIFVTGASGFIGSALVRKLRDKHEVFGPGRDEIDLSSGPVKLDLFVREHDVDCIVHLANPRIYNTNHAMGEGLVQLKNVLDVCRQNQVRLIYLSNWEVYSGYSSDLLLASETLPPLPKGIYGETKFLCEQLLEQHRRNYDLQSVLLRSSSVYGTEGDRPRFIFNFLAKAANDEKIVTHKYLNGFPTLDLLHIDDLTRALSAAIDSDYTGTLHVGSGQGVSTTQVANLIVKITGSKSRVEHSEIQDYAPNIVMDYSRARSVLGWEPRITFEKGLRLVIADRLPQLAVTGEEQ